MIDLLGITSSLLAGGSESPAPGGGAGGAASANKQTGRDDNSTDNSGGIFNASGLFGPTIINESEGYDYSPSLIRRTNAAASSTAAPAPEEPGLSYSSSLSATPEVLGLAVVVAVIGAIWYASKK